MGLSAGDESDAQAFSTAIDRFSALDSRSPDTLETRLRFADFLAKSAGGDCRIRLDEAQRQLEAVRATPAISVVLPAGLAQAAGVEYQIDLASADCSGDPVVRQRELHAALEAALRGVELYRDAFDAASMVTMQFNAGIVYRSLGDNSAAVAALRAAIDMDREYGYQDDAEDNYRLLLQWNGEESGPTQIAALMQDFPQRSVTLKFGWYGSDADISLQSDFARLVGDEIVRDRGTNTAHRRVRKRVSRWVVSYQIGNAQYNAGTPPVEDAFADGLITSLTRMLLHFQDFDVARGGDFDEVTAPGTFAAGVRVNADALIRDLASKSDRAPQLARRINDAVKAALAPGSIAAEAAEDYALETGTWIGATLEQGVWYDMSIPLWLPLAPQLLVAHKVEFAYTRQVPCTVDSPALSCIEIVVHAVPDPAVQKMALGLLLRSSHLPRGQEPSARAVTYMRLVTDPNTLVPYIREMRLHSYWSTGAAGPNHSLSQSERSVFVTERVTPRAP